MQKSCMKIGLQKPCSGHCSCHNFCFFQISLWYIHIVWLKDTEFYLLFFNFFELLSIVFFFFFFYQWLSIPFLDRVTKKARRFFRFWVCFVSHCLFRRVVQESSQLEAQMVGVFQLITINKAITNGQRRIDFRLETL